MDDSTDFNAIRISFESFLTSFLKKISFDMVSTEKSNVINKTIPLFYINVLTYSLYLNDVTFFNSLLDTPPPMSQILNIYN